MNERPATALSGRSPAPQSVTATCGLIWPWTGYCFAYRQATAAPATIYGRLRTAPVANSSARPAKGKSGVLLSTSASVRRAALRRKCRAISFRLNQCL